MGKIKENSNQVQLHCIYYSTIFQKMQPQILLIFITHYAKWENVAHIILCMAISASSKSHKNQHVFLKSRIVQFLRHIRTMFCRRKFFRYKLLTNTPTGYIIDTGRPFRSYPEKRRKAVSIMVKTTLKIDGMMCSMCEAHMNDLVRQNCSANSYRHRELGD